MLFQILGRLLGKDKTSKKKKKMEKKCGTRRLSTPSIIFVERENNETRNGTATLICCRQALETTDATAQRDYRHTTYGYGALLIPDDHH